MIQLHAETYSANLLKNMSRSKQDMKQTPEDTVRYPNPYHSLETNHFSKIFHFMPTEKKSSSSGVRGWTILITSNLIVLAHPATKLYQSHSSGSGFVHLNSEELGFKRWNTRSCQKNRHINHHDENLCWDNTPLRTSLKRPLEDGQWRRGDN